MKLALQIAPQHSQQYADMARDLALPEVLACPVEPRPTSAELATIGSQGFVILTFDRDLSAQEIEPLTTLAASNQIYLYYDTIGDVSGPLLKPLSQARTPGIPQAMSETRRYKGKTNELFTNVLINLAWYASSFKNQRNIRLLDPVAGGSTTLFLALSKGMDAIGIERNRDDVTASQKFVEQYIRAIKLPIATRRERPNLGLRYINTINNQQLVLLHGDSTQAATLMQGIPGGTKVHLIAGDLPYGIQHYSEEVKMIKNLLPAMEEILLPGGAIALGWNATRISREAMLEIFASSSTLTVLNDPPYNQLSHVVDRVIKQRDIIVAIKKS